MPPGRLHVDVDVGQRRAHLPEEALEEQVVLERVDVGDAQQVVDEAARAGSAGLVAHPHVAHERADVGDREEVGGEAEARDGRELGAHAREHALPHRLVDVPEPLGGPGLGLPPERLVRVSRDADDGLLRQLRLPPGEVGVRIQPAAVGELLGGAQQRLARPAVERRRARDLPRDPLHLGRGLQPRLPVGLRAEGPERPERAGRVEHVARERVVGLEVADGVGEHRGDAVGVGELEHAGGVAEARGLAGLCEVADHLDDHRAGQQPRPLGQVAGCERVVARRDGAADVRVGPEHDRAHRTVLAEEERGRPGARDAGLRAPGGAPRRAAPVARADEPAERRPALAARAAVREHRDPARVLAREPELRADHGGDAGGEGAADVADGAVEPVAVGDRRGRRALGRDPVDERLGRRGAEVGGEGGRDVQVGEAHARLPRCPPASSPGAMFERMFDSPSVGRLPGSRDP